jgi:hypothetical protein
VPSASAELTLFAWTLSKGDKNPLRRLMAKRQRFINELKAGRGPTLEIVGKTCGGGRLRVGLAMQSFCIRGRLSWKPMVRARSLAKAVVAPQGYDGRLRAFERESARATFFKICQVLCQGVGISLSRQTRRNIGSPTVPDAGRESEWLLCVETLSGQCADPSEPAVA